MPKIPMPKAQIEVLETRNTTEFTPRGITLARKPMIHISGVHETSSEDDVLLLEKTKQKQG